MSYDLRINLSSKDIKKNTAQAFLDSQEDIESGVFKGEKQSFMNIFLEEIEADRTDKSLVYNFHIPYSFSSEDYETYQKVIGRFVTHFNIPAIDLQSHQEIYPVFHQDSPSILIFSLNEVGRSYGELFDDIPVPLNNCPFYIFDKTLNSTPVFEDEISVNDETVAVGFDILRTIWTEYIAVSKTFAFNSLFLKTYNQNQPRYSVKCTYGFAPGYDLNSGYETLKKQGFNVFTWEQFWNKF